jgi:D-arabinose 1-dehydrogenase-like Zn-dependent alcohol dehydrogenase
MAPAVVPGRVGVADVDAGKRETAARAGAAFTVDNGSPGGVTAVKDWSNGGVDAAIDFVGRPETARFAIDSLRKGGTLVVVGLYGDRLPLPLPWLPLRVLTLRGSYVGTLQDLKDVIALAKAGKLPPISVEPRPIDRVNDALSDLSGGKVAGRVVLKP